MEDIDKKIREIKISRSYLNFLDDKFLNIEYKISDDNKVHTFIKDNIILFELNYKSSTLWINFNLIYKYLLEKYKLSDDNINSVLHDYIGTKVKHNPKYLKILPINF